MHFMKAQRNYAVLSMMASNQFVSFWKGIYFVNLFKPGGGASTTEGYTLNVHNLNRVDVSGKEEG